MNISRVEKKQEAIKRMKVLDIFAESIRQFEQDGMLSCSEPPFGANYHLNDEQKKIVRQFEEEYNALVYFAIRSYTNFGTLDSFLFVSDYPEEWGKDNWDLKDGDVYAYVYNYDAPECSEIGMIGVKPRFGGLVRTY